MEDYISKNIKFEKLLGSIYFFTFNEKKCIHNSFLSVTEDKRDMMIRVFEKYISIQNNIIDKKTTEGKCTYLGLQNSFKKMLAIEKEKEHTKENLEILKENLLNIELI